MGRKSSIERTERRNNTPYAASLPDLSDIPPMKLNTACSRFNMLSPMTIMVSGRNVATIIDRGSNSPERRRKKTRSATLQSATISRNNELIEFAASRSHFSTGMA